MTSELHSRVSEAVAAGASLAVIEQTIIDRAPIDEEFRAALWLYAAALRERPHACARIEAARPQWGGS